MMSARETPPKQHRRPPKLVRIVRARPRLFACVAVGMVVSAALTFTVWRIAWRLLIAWDIAVSLYLALVLRLAWIAESHHIRGHARREDEGRFAILALTALAALASLGAIFALLGGAGTDGRRPPDLVLATVTILISWAFTHTMFALHYAHEYYDRNGGNGGGMTFPGDRVEPDYWDFLYFSFVIGMCAQVSDVTVTSQSIRRTVLGHSVVSFIFNAALLALTVNIAASAI
jgi:uncharacterized membrane protein